MAMETGKKEFTGSKLTKHFKMDKQTKRMLALCKFPGTVKLSADEQAKAEINLSPLTKNDFKSLMIRGQLSEADSRMTGMDDPMWKPKKVSAEESEGEAGKNSPSTNNGKPAERKGKKHLKMRDNKIVAVEEGKKQP